MYAVVLGMQMQTAYILAARQADRSTQPALCVRLHTVTPPCGNGKIADGHGPVRQWLRIARFSGCQNACDGHCPGQLCSRTLTAHGGPCFAHMLGNGGECTLEALGASGQASLKFEHARCAGDVYLDQAAAGD